MSQGGSFRARDKQITKYFTIDVYDRTPTAEATHTVYPYTDRNGIYNVNKQTLKANGEIGTAKSTLVQGNLLPFYRKSKEHNLSYFNK